MGAPEVAGRSATESARPRIRGRELKALLLALGRPLAALLARLPLGLARRVTRMGAACLAGASYIAPGNPGIRMVKDLAWLRGGAVNPSRIWQRFVCDVSESVAKAYASSRGDRERVFAREVAFEEGSEAVIDGTVSRWGSPVVFLTHSAACYVGIGFWNRRFPIRMVWRTTGRPIQVAFEEGQIAALEAPVLAAHDVSGFAFFRQCLRLLADGVTLALTPDRPALPEEGVAVTVFGARAHLPLWQARIAARAKRPILPAHVYFEGTRVRVAVEPPIEPASPERMMEAWAPVFERQILAHPQDWNFILDRKWRRIVREGVARLQAASRLEERP